MRKRGVEREYETKAAFECVERSGAFKNWLHSSTSQIFILSGRNDSHATHCWLSPVALKLIADKTSLDATSKAKNICVFETINLRNERNSYEHIIRSLMDQLLSEIKNGMGKDQELQALDRYMETYLRLVKTPDLPLYEMQEILAKILAQILALFDPGTAIWMVLDRADQCRTSRASESSGNKNQQRIALLRTLVYAIEQSRIVLKILVVVKTSDWDVEKHADNLRQEKEDSVVIETFEDEDYTY